MFSVPLYPETRNCPFRSPQSPSARNPPPPAAAAGRWLGRGTAAKGTWEGIAPPALHEGFPCPAISSDGEEVPSPLPAPPRLSKHTFLFMPLPLSGWRENLTRRCLCNQAITALHKFKTNFSLLTKCQCIHRQSIKISVYLKGRRLGHRLARGLGTSRQQTFI